jgi:hypothetical protein
MELLSEAEAAIGPAIQLRSKQAFLELKGA